jgi:hypothetical protein
MALRRLTHRVCRGPSPARLAPSGGGRCRALIFAEHAQNFKGRQRASLFIS